MLLCIVLILKACQQIVGFLLTAAMQHCSCRNETPAHHTRSSWLTRHWRQTSANLQNDICLARLQMSGNGLVAAQLSCFLAMLPYSQTEHMSILEYLIMTAQHHIELVQSQLKIVVQAVPPEIIIAKIPEGSGTPSDLGRLGSRRSA